MPSRRSGARATRRRRETTAGGCAARAHDRRPRVASAAMRLETDRLALRPLAAGDLDALTDLDGHPEVLRFVDPFAETPADRAVRPSWIEDPWSRSPSPTPPSNA